MTNQQIEKNLTVGQISDRLWHASLVREGRIARNDPLPEWIDPAPARTAPAPAPAEQSALSAGLCKAASKIDGGLAVLEAHLTVALRKGVVGLFCAFTLAASGALAARDLIRGERDAMSRLRQDGLDLWAILKGA